jgi:type II secretory pathway pseudopilin PulG
MDTLKNLKIKGNTIIETVIALTIILIVFGIATTLFVETIKEQDSIKTIKATGVLQAYANRTISEKDFFNSSEQDNEFILKREITDTSAFINLIRIHFSILDTSQKMVNEWDQLVSK